MKRNLYTSLVVSKQWATNVFTSPYLFSSVFFYTEHSPWGEPLFVLDVHGQVCLRLANHLFLARTLPTFFKAK